MAETNLATGGGDPVSLSMVRAELTGPGETPTGPIDHEGVLSGFQAFYAEKKQQAKATGGTFGLRNLTPQLGLDRQTLSQLLRDGATVDSFRTARPGNNIDATLRLVAEFLQQEKERAMVGRSKVFVRTRIAAEIHGAFNIIAKRPRFGVVMAPSGYGKTSAILEYVSRRKLRPLYIPCDFSYSAQALALAVLNLFDAGRSANLTLLTKLAVEKLRQRPYFLIIDDAHFLNLRAMEILRTIFDNTEISIALIGQPTLHMAVQGEGREAYAQIFSRISVEKWITLEMLADEDLREVIAANYPALGGAENNFILRFVRSTKGGFRRVRILVELAEDLASGKDKAGKIDVGTLKRATSLLVR